MSSEHITQVSTIQRQFWLLQQLTPDTRAYLVPSVFHIEGLLNVDALRAALECLAAKHASLRTTFEQRKGELVQVVHERLPSDFEYRVADDELSLDSAAVQASLQLPFDLERGPLFRIRLWRLPSGCHLMTWTMHHIIVDLASKDILSKDLSCFYASALDNRPVPQITPPCDNDYASFVRWEQSYLAGPECKEGRDYFKQHVGHEFEPLLLPEDRKRPLVQPCHGSRESFVLPTDLGARVEGYCAANATKPFLVLLTAWAIVLARYGNTSGVTIGVPFSNRRREQSQHTVGAFVNDLPLRVLVPKDATFSDILRQVRATMLQHHRRQELGFEQIVAYVNPPRDPSHSPLFQAGFTFEPPMSLALGNAEVRSVKAHAGGAQLDVFLTIWRSDVGWFGQIEYADELFDASTIARLVRNYLNIVAHALETGAESIRPAARLPLMSADERKMVLSDFNATETSYPGPSLVHEFFLEQASRSENSIALRFGEKSLTYGQLRERARSVAGLLLDNGVRPGHHVGIYMQRSLEMVVAIYGVLFAGATYVPIDPEYPLSRIANMIEDAEPAVVLTHAPVVASFPSGGIKVLEIDVTHLPDRDVAIAHGSVPRDALYTLFTSGSTGRPKGATNTHAGIRNRVLWMQDAFALGPDDVVLQKTPFSFDVSTWEFFWPLFVGATLDIAPHGAHRDPSILCRIIQERKVTVLHFVPSMLGAFLEHPGAEKCTSLRLIMASGEALNSALVQRTAAIISGASLHNLYGPTEAAVDVSWWDCSADVNRDPVPIGKPISNTQLYVLDPYLEPVPVGVPGELYIGGVQVALGYVNRPELTEQRFIFDPFSNRRDARLYKTGDLVRWLPDGNIVFLGRLDHQIKLRGQRIELGEIESAIESLPGVRQCVVVVHPLRALDARLVAYVATTSEGSGRIVADSLRSQLGKLLPSYMVPATFIWLKELPLSPNGKIDRKALPAPELESRVQMQSVLPRSEVEQWIFAQIQELTGSTQFGVLDNLFESGVTSIMVAQLVGRIQRQYSVELPLVRLFEYSTIRRLAEHLMTLKSPTFETASQFDGLQARAQRRLSASAPRPRRS